MGIFNMWGGGGQGSILIKILPESLFSFEEMLQGQLSYTGNRRDLPKLCLWCINHVCLLNTKVTINTVCMPQAKVKY